MSERGAVLAVGVEGQAGLGDDKAVASPAVSSAPWAHEAMGWSRVFFSERGGPVCNEGSQLSGAPP